jgi:uncharacterized protein
MTELEEFRAEKDRFFASDPHSPLQPDQKRAFTGLKYFPENPALRFETAVKRFTRQETIQIQISSGDIQEYIRYGIFIFLVDGEEVELTIYADSNSYFLPFVDALAGLQTYAAGRYIEPIPLGEDKFLIDFNYAYNPYCAYNEYWSCPLTPVENRLSVAIQAGEKIFH